MDSEQQTRRQFCRHTCTAAGLAAIGGAAAMLQGCGGGSPTSSSGGPSASSLPRINGTASGGTIQVAIDAASPLAAAGSVAFVSSAAGNVLVARGASDAFTAVTAICTHESCLITGFSGQSYVCPCHGSQFDSAGLRPGRCVSTRRSSPLAS
jgi:nitrite reductase/ring-hydroxylating ferredoxin subunit